MATPFGLYFASKDVTSERGAGAHDRFSISFNDAEKAKLGRVLRLTSRNPSQFAASAFYRSPAFSLERILLGVIFVEYQSNHELYTRNWTTGETVSGAFMVVSRSPTSLLSVSNGFGTLIGLYNDKMILSSHIPISIDQSTLWWKIASTFHNGYSRVLLAGAKWKLFGDVDKILSSSQIQ